MNWLDAFLNSKDTLAVLVLCIGIGVVISFARGWLLTPFQIRTLTDTQNRRIEEANKRGDDWQTAYDKQTQALGLALDQLDRLKIIGDTTSKVLASLPAPPIQGVDERVDT